MPLPPARVVSLTNCAILRGDVALRDKCRMAFVDRLRYASILAGDQATIDRALVATRILRNDLNFERGWLTHYWPALLAPGQIDNSATDATINAECDRLIASLADVPVT